LGDKLERCPKMKVIDVSGTLAEAIRRYATNMAVIISEEC
jgi:phosphoribosylpyrophosphate synthetase